MPTLHVLSRHVQGITALRGIKGIFEELCLSEAMSGILYMYETMLN